MHVKLLQITLWLVAAVLYTVCGDVDTERVQKFHFQTATHYRKEYKDRDGRMYGEYGVHMPNGWTKVLLYETSDNKVLRLVHEYRTPTNQLNDERSTFSTKEQRKPSRNEELENETRPEIQIIAVPQLWKVRGQDLFAEASEPRPVTLALAGGSGQLPTLAPPRLTDQRALYNFGYDAPHHGHNETGTESGAKFGEYYVDLPNCWRSVVRYWADESGYHPTMRQVRTPGCEQQKREAVSSSPAAETPAESPAPAGAGDAGARPRTGPQPQGSPAAVARDRSANPAPAERRKASNSPPPGAPASCAARSSSGGGDGESEGTSRPYGFAYNAGTHYHWERGFANGTKVGGYAVQLPDGTLRTTTYTADCSGFRPSVTVEPLDEAKFLRDFEKFNPPKEAKLFERGSQPQASAFVRSEPQPAPQSLRRAQTPQGLSRSAEVSGAPPRLAETQRKTTAAPTTTTRSTTTTEPPTTTEPTTTTTTTTTAAPTSAPTAATTRTSTSPNRPSGVSPRRSPARRLAPIVPIRPPGSGPYHFYVHLRYNYHEERGYNNGTVAGQYGVVGPDGVLREVGYTSEHGYVPTLTDTPVSADHDLSTRPRKF